MHRGVLWANDVFRFALECAALAALAVGAWTLADGTVLSLVLAVLFPLVAMVAWGTFRVPGDPGPAPVEVPGIVRLSLEVDCFTAAVVMLMITGRVSLGLILAALVVVHYAIGYQRVLWLIRERPAPSR